jgi:hypothetical protein
MGPRPAERLLEQFLPAHQFSEQHTLQMPAPPHQVMACIEAVLREPDPLVSRLIALREAPARLWQRMGGQGRLPARPFGLDDFTLLERRGHEELVFGLAGQFWRADYGLTPVADAQAFHALQDVPRLALHFGATPVGTGTLLSTSTRVHCPDAVSLRRFTPYWYLIRPVSGFIRRRLLQRVARAVALAG